MRRAPVDSAPVTTPSETASHAAPRTDAVAARKAEYEQLRRLSTWRLLAATKAPAVLAILQSVFPAGDRRLPRSEMIARVGLHLHLLHDEAGEGNLAGPRRAPGAPRRAPSRTLLVPRRRRPILRRAAAAPPPSTATPGCARAT